MRSLSPVRRLSFTCRRTLDHHGVRRNLIAAAKLYDVVEHDPLKVELAFRAVADNLGLFCGKQSEAVRPCA